MVETPNHLVSAAADAFGGVRQTLLAVVFGVLAALSAIAPDHLLTVDEPLSELMRGESLQGLFGVVTAVGATETAIAVAVVVATALWRRCRTLAVLYPATLLVAAGVNVGLKALVGRPRPPAPDTGTALASFPSGHALQATLLFGFLPLTLYVFTDRRLVVRLTAIAAGFAIVAVGSSRVYLGAHWPTDIIGGVLVGAALIQGAQILITRHRAQGSCRCASRGWSSRLDLA